MKLPYYLDCNKLEQHLRDGYVEQRGHNTLPLIIYCYSRKAMFDNVWDDVTTKCRGLIVEAKPTMDIIARPFEKFFNLNHEGRPETDLQVVLAEPSSPTFSEKLDGSMGTYWKYGNEIGIATKGSFHSEQAEWATQWLKKRWTNIPSSPANQSNVHAWPVGFTPVFEIIAQSVQHHVVHYLPEDDNQLVLIGLVNNETGAEMGPEQLHLWASINGIKAVESWNDISLHEVITSDRPDKEGVVATWFRNGKPPLKVKIKHATFLKLQKIAHHTTPKTIFQALRSGDQTIIDEALQFGSLWLKYAVAEWVQTYVLEYKKLQHEAASIVQSSLITCTTRKESAAYFHGMSTTLAPVCFNIIDQKDPAQAIWDLVEPIVKTIKYDEVEEEA
jgi:hypothetical protein